MSAGAFVSRGGLKLAHALATLSVDARGLVCADFGCSTGGFTDCLLQAGAARVYAIDTAYGQLAWTLRNDPRVTVLERTNALHARPPADLAAAGGVDLVVADLGWTPQKLLIPAALKWIKPAGRLITLIKPHYELKAADPARLPRGGVLDESLSAQVTQETLAAMAALGVRVISTTPSPILGGEHKGKGTGNVEVLALVERG